MGPIFGGGGSPQVIQVPVERPAPEPIKSEEDAKKKLRRGAGERSTMRTGSLGIADEPERVATTVLGGK